MNHDIYLRAYTVQLDEKKSQRGATQHHSQKWPKTALIIDCESRITPDQTLTCGFWRFSRLQDGIYVCMEEGIFHNETRLTAAEFDLLREYVRRNRPEATAGGCSRLRLYSRQSLSMSSGYGDPSQGADRVLQCRI